MTQSDSPLRMNYGDGPSQFVDRWRPDRPDTRGTIVLLHGGWWRDIWDLHLMDPLSVWLSDLGYRVCPLVEAWMSRPIQRAD